MEWSENFVSLKEEVVKPPEPCSLFQEYLFLPEYGQDFVFADDNWTESNLDSACYPQCLYPNLLELLQPEVYIKPELVSLDTEGVTKAEVEKPKRRRNCCADRQKKKITAYNPETTTYLQSVFFDIYSKQSKLTKQQRREVQDKTGLPSRNITYWFSNHKRRFQASLNQFKKLHASPSLTYLDFIRWRRKQSLMDRPVTQPLN